MFSLDGFVCCPATLRAARDLMASGNRIPHGSGSFSSFSFCVSSWQFFNLVGAIQAPIGKPFKTLAFAHYRGAIFFANSRSSRKRMLHASAKTQWSDKY